MVSDDDKRFMIQFPSGNAEADSQLLKSIIESAPGFIYIYDNSLKTYVFVSENLFRVLGYPKTESVDAFTGFVKMAHPEDVKRLLERREKVILSSTEELYSCVHRVRTRSGDWFWLQTLERVFERNEDGSVFRTIGFGRDISGFQKAERVLVETLEQNEFLLETSRILSDPTSDYSTTLNDLARSISQHFEVVCDISILNLDTEEIIPAAFYHDDAFVTAALQKVFSENKVVVGQGMVGKVISTGEEILLNPVSDEIKKGPRKVSQRIVPQALVYKPLKGSKRVFGSLNLSRLEGQDNFSENDLDRIQNLASHVSLFIENVILKEEQKKEIETRKRIEHKLERTAEILAKTEEETRNILNAIPIYISRVSKDFRYTFINDAYKKMGVDPRKMEGRSVVNVLGTEIFESLRPRFEKVLSGEAISYDYNGVMADGIERYFNVALAPDFEEDGSIKGFFSCASDITSKVKAELETKRTQDRLESLSLNSGDAFFFHDAEQNILDVNQVTVDMLGYSRSELLRLKARDIDPRWNGKSFGKFLEKLEENQPQTFDTLVRHKNGYEIPVEVRFVKRVEEGKTYIQSLLRDRTEKTAQERKLIESEERLRLIFENVEDHIATCDANGVFESINRTSQGLTREDVIGSTIFDFGDDEMQVAALKRKFEDLKRNGTAFELESTYTGPDSSTSWYTRKYIPVFYGDRFFKAIVIIRNVTAERSKEHSIMNAMLRGQEQERKRLGAELHDGIGQVLSSISLDVSQIASEESLLNEELIAQELEALKLKIQMAIKEIRNISHDLMPEVLESFGLAEAVKQICNSLHDRSGINVKFDHVDLQERYDPLLEMNMYRMTQELLTNIQNHAASSKVFVSLIDHGNTINLMVEDDGVGFNTADDSPGIGLKNVSSRVGVLNGVMDIESELGSGTLINIEIPKKQE